MLCRNHRRCTILERMMFSVTELPALASCSSRQAVATVVSTMLAELAHSRRPFQPQKGTILYATAQECDSTSSCSATNISTTVKVVKGGARLLSGTPAPGPSQALARILIQHQYICTVTNQTTQAHSANTSTDVAGHTSI